jgi:hypothetical protein
LPKDDLKAKGMNPFKCLKAKKKQTRGNLKWSGKKACSIQKLSEPKVAQRLNTPEESQHLHAILRSHQTKMLISKSIFSPLARRSSL